MFTEYYCLFDIVTTSNWMTAMQAGLIEGALEDAGTILAIITHPERGSNAIIEYANKAFSAIMRQSRVELESFSIGEKFALVADPHTARLLIDALRSGIPTQLDLHLTVGKPESWFGLRLTFPSTDGIGARHAVVTGRDITAARKAAMQEDDFRRLLASIFMRIDAAVAIITSCGEITMANPAFHHLTGYSADELRNVRVDALTPPEYADEARAARAKQLGDGQRYELRLETFVKGGARVAIQLTSILLRDGDQRMRVVTLKPAATASAARPGREAGELRAVSLAAFRSAFGGGWERIATRAMMRAEQIIRRKLGESDVVSRADGHNFIIWFGKADHEENGTVLAGIVREIRLNFLTEFGEEAAAQVSATLVPVDDQKSPFDMLNHAPADLAETMRHQIRSTQQPSRPALGALAKSWALLK